MEGQEGGFSCFSFLFPASFIGKRREIDLGNTDLICSRDTRDRGQKSKSDQFKNPFLVEKEASGRLGVFLIFMQRII